MSPTPRLRGIFGDDAHDGHLRNRQCGCTHSLTAVLPAWGQVSSNLAEFCAYRVCDRGCALRVAIRRSDLEDDRARRHGCLDGLLELRGRCWQS